MMDKILTGIVVVFGIILLLWVAFGISAILFSFFALFMAKAEKSGANINSPFAGFLACLLFCSAIGAVIVMGSAFLNIFLGLLVDLPLTDEQFETNICSQSINFSKDIFLALFLGIIAYRYFGKALGVLTLPTVYLMSNATTFLIFDFETYDFNISFNTDIKAWAEYKIYFLKNSLSTIIDFQHWLSFFKFELVFSGGNLLVFEPLFAFITSITGILSFVFSRKRVVLPAEPEAFKQILTCSVVACSIFITSASFFFWAPTYLSSNSTNAFLSLIVALVQILSFPVFLISFLVWVGFSLLLFLPAKLMEET